MVPEPEFVAIAAFLFSCVVSWLPRGRGAVAAEAGLTWRRHGPAGWGRWREAHFGLTAADRRILVQSEPVPDRAATAALIDTVLHQARRPESDAVQFAIVRASQDSGQHTVVFVSDVHNMAAAI